MSAVYRVCIPHTSRDYFDYTSSEFRPLIGARVWVPFRNSSKLGIVLGSSSDSVATAKLKAITALIDQEPVLDKDVLTLCYWMASYYQSPLSEVLPLALPKKYREGLATALPLADYYHLLVPEAQATELIATRAHKQRQLIAYLAAHQQPVSKQELSQHGFNSSHILPLLNSRLIALSQQVIIPHQAAEAAQKPLPLNEEQAVAVEAINQHLDRYQCFLLQGITGSGKTEVYLQVIAKVLAQGKQVLVMVPEIGLTPQLLSRFTARFTRAMAVIHSSLNDTERQIAWQLAKEHKVQLVIGTRAAVFTPLPDLGLIVIDEEHDSSLKQMEGVRYSARDTALMRAHRAQIPIILGSATPSLESLYNCQQHKYQLLRLNHKALTSTPLHYQLIDLRAQALNNGLTTTTLHLIKEHLDKGNQALVFINRRGFAPVLLCHQCGWMADCRACDSHLTLHRHNEQLICHHCGLMQKKPQQCGSCQSRELIAVGAGTQRIHEFLSSYFPKTAVLRIDRDEVSKKNALEQHLAQISSGAAQLIVGTQMLAKGHHFPNLSLVVVLDADAGLYNQDFRALEHLGQLLTQVAGRAGRAEHAGQVVIQTHQPDHPLLNILIQKGYDAFAKELLATRAQAELPPFHFLAVIRAQAKTPAQALQFLHAIKQYIKQQPIVVMGPAPAPLARKANQYRMQLLLKSPSRLHLKNTLTDLRQWLTLNKITNGVRWNVDVDPMDLS